MRLPRFAGRKLRTIWFALLAGFLAGTAQLALADSEYAAAWGPSVGSSVPMLNAQDQSGEQQTLNTLTGTNGVLFVFNRSVDW